MINHIDTSMLILLWIESMAVSNFYHMLRANKNHKWKLIVACDVMKYILLEAPKLSVDLAVVGGQLVSFVISSYFRLSFGRYGLHQIKLSLDCHGRQLLSHIKTKAKDGEPSKEELVQLE